MMVATTGVRGEGAGIRMLPTRRLAVDLTALFVVLMTVLAGFWTSFSGPSFLLPTVGGTAVGLAIAAVSAWRRWSILVVTGLTVGAYFVMGSALAVPALALWGFIPTLQSLTALALAPVVAWKQMLTTVTPLSGADGQFLVPFMLALVAAVIAGSLSLRLRRAEWALIPVVALLCMVIAMGSPQPWMPVVQGVLIAVVAVAWPALRRLWNPDNAAVSADAGDPLRATRMRMRRMVTAGVVLVIAGGAGAAAGAWAEPDQARHVLRDTVIPPFVVREYASPLQSFRGYLKDHREDTLFTISGLPDDTRIRLGVMDGYNGVVYNVAAGGLGTSGAFTPLRSTLNDGAEGREVSVDIVVDDYAGVWMPHVGLPSQITFDGERAETLRREAFFNDVTGMPVTTAGLSKGDTYRVAAVVPDVPSDEKLAEAEFGNIRMPKQEGVPDDIARLASETVADAKTPIEQVRALETYLAEGGFFSHGLEGEVISRAGHGAERILTLLGGDQMIGDDEQYAVTMALLAREVGIPARVVMGFYPDDDREMSDPLTIRGDDVHAWVEVNFAGFGWVEFNPTPSEDKLPNDQTTKPKADPKPQVLQPPPPPQEPVDLPPTLPDERESEDETENPFAYLGLILVVAISLMALIALLLSPFIIIGAWKAARRRKRRLAERSADRISGAWDEITDRATDYGVRFSQGATRTEEAVTVTESFAEETMGQKIAVLAQRADADVFGPSDPSPEQIDEYWAQADDVVNGFAQSTTLGGRLRARLSLRSLTADSAVSRGWKNIRVAATARAKHDANTKEPESR
ncbi:transglutaminase-like domain-containing protein [Microbacterium sp. YY-01]|uniref:transglutaminase-like domain-containing protein n=1 Tax=Microbacterium sp. YY-01 TaxID=3421634 RepID=UPI003D16F329